MIRIVKRFIMRVLLAICVAAPSVLGAQKSLQTRAPAISIRDTARYKNEAGAGGTRGLLYIDKRFVDSVDLDFGVHVVGRDSVLFLPVRDADITNHLLLVRNKRIKLTKRLPYLDDYFSSPAVDRQIIYYWGQRLMAGDQRRLYAIRYDFRRARLDSLPLDYFNAGTDYRFYFSPPEIQGDSIVYADQCFTYIVDSTFRSFHRRLAPDPGLSVEACNEAVTYRLVNPAHEDSVSIVLSLLDYVMLQLVPSGPKKVDFLVIDSAYNAWTRLAYDVAVKDAPSFMRAANDSVAHYGLTFRIESVHVKGNNAAITASLARCEQGSGMNWWQHDIDYRLVRGPGFWRGVSQSLGREADDSCTPATAGKSPETRRW
jgi:hypothetical protein